MHFSIKNPDLEKAGMVVPTFSVSFASLAPAEQDGSWKMTTVYTIDSTRHSVLARTDLQSLVFPYYAAIDLMNAFFPILVR